MPRLRRRVCLQDGPFLDLNWLLNNNFISRGALTGERNISWDHPFRGRIASASIVADMRNERTGSLILRMDNFSQELVLIAEPRNFGGRQWYFVCPVTGRNASIIWKPAGADRFCSRHAWADQVAYLSQFGNWIDRAHLGKAKIKAKLLGDSDPEKWELPPRPKGMRLATYEHWVARFDEYQSRLDAGLEALYPEFRNGH